MYVSNMIIVWFKLHWNYQRNKNARRYYRSKHFTLLSHPLNKKCISEGKQYSYGNHTVKISIT